jgi:hypothetical protein
MPPRITPDPARLSAVVRAQERVDRAQNALRVAERDRGKALVAAIGHAREGELCAALGVSTPTLWRWVRAARSDLVKRPRTAQTAGGMDRKGATNAIKTEGRRSARPR